MSATMDAELFSKYLGCPRLTTAGRTFPVEVSYLEDVYENLQYKSFSKERFFDSGLLKVGS